MRTLILLLAMVALNVQAQDLIVLKDSHDTIHCFIVEKNSEFLRYQMPDSSDTTIYKIAWYKYDSYYYNYERSKDTILRTFKRGMYMNFLQFQNNTPEKDLPLKVIKRKGFDKATGGNDYMVKSLSDSITTMQIASSYLIVCDGQNCYVNCGIISDIDYFSRLSVKGDYAYFYAVPFTPSERYSGERVYIMNSGHTYMPSPTGGTMMGGGFGVGTSVSISINRKWYKVDMKTGEFVP